MKKAIKLFTVLVTISSLFVSSCKKGENDPFISLKSRSARLTGDWKLTSGTVTETTTFTSSSTTNVETTTYTDATKTITETSGSSTSTDVYNYTQTITFDKDGTYSSVTTETQTSSNGTDIPSSLQSTDTDNEGGNWAFLGKNKDSDLKRKEALAFTPREMTSTTVSSFGTVTSTSTSEGWNFAGVMLIDQLKNKEIIFKGKYSSSSSSSTVTTEYEYIYTAQ